MDAWVPFAISAAVFLVVAVLGGIAGVQEWKAERAARAAKVRKKAEQEKALKDFRAAVLDLGEALSTAMVESMADATKAIEGITAAMKAAQSTPADPTERIATEQRRK